MINDGISLLLIAGLASLIFLQNSRSLFIRSSGLVLILVAITTSLALSRFPQNSVFILLPCFIIGALGFFSDYSSPTLRTWFFTVSGRTIYYVMNSIMFGLILLPLLLGAIFSVNFNPIFYLLLSTIIGAIIGESFSLSSGKSLNRAGKSVIGTVSGMYGLATKLILGMIMVDIFLNFSH